MKAAKVQPWLTEYNVDCDRRRKRLDGLHPLVDMTVSVFEISMREMIFFFIFCEVLVLIVVKDKDRGIELHEQRWIWSREDREDLAEVDQRTGMVKAVHHAAASLAEVLLEELWHVRDWLLECLCVAIHFDDVQTFATVQANVVWLHRVGAAVWADRDDVERVLFESFCVFGHIAKNMVYDLCGQLVRRRDLPFFGGFLLCPSESVHVILVVIRGWFTGGMVTRSQVCRGSEGMKLWKQKIEGRLLVARGTAIMWD